MNRKSRISLVLLLVITLFVVSACGLPAQQTVPAPAIPSQPASSKLETTTQQQTTINQSLTVPHGVPVLMYHSIGDEPNNDAVISKERFAEQMAFLHSKQYNPLTLDELYSYITAKKPLPPKPVVITFDDGYRDTYDVALPILKKYGFRSTMFIPAGDVGKYLTWQQLREMKAAGMDIGSHSYTHRELDGLSREVQAAEITKAKELLDRELNQDTRWFCYPYGTFNQTTKELLKANGITIAVTIKPGWTKAGDDPLTLQRVWLGNGVTLKHFEERLTSENYSIL